MPIVADSLVEAGVRRYGRFVATPSHANPLEEFTGLARRFADFRLKEWVGFTLTHPDLYSSMIMQDAKYLASSEIYVWDRASRRLAQHAANAAGGSLHLPSDLLHDRCQFRAKGYWLSYEFSEERIVVTVDVDGRGGVPHIGGELILDPTRAGHPLVVSSKLPAGGTMYTNKIIFGAGGALRVGEREYTFDPSRDLAIVDEHKSHLPYRTDWTWGTFAMPIEAGHAGANFVLRPHLAGQEEESCIWTPEAAEPLAEVSFEPVGTAELAPWRISSADGRLDVTFTPEGRKGVKHDLGVIAIEYFQMFGLYRGVLRGADRRWEFTGVHGVCERMHARL